MENCTKIAVYASPDGSMARVPIPASVVPTGFTAIRGRARFLVAVIDVDDPRDDETLIQEAMREVEQELAALAEDAA
jgi:hypothetical protein